MNCGNPQPTEFYRIHSRHYFSEIQRETIHPIFQFCGILFLRRCLLATFGLGAALSFETGKLYRSASNPTRFWIASNSKLVTARRPKIIVASNMGCEANLSFNTIDADPQRNGGSTAVLSQ